MEYTPYTLLVDIGLISALLLIGKLIRAYTRPVQSLLIPSSITAGILGLIFGPAVLGWLPFSDQLGTYSTILIAVVFGAMPYSMEFSGRVLKGARAMWSFSTGMYVLQWGAAVLFGLIVLSFLFDTPDWFGLMLPVGWVGGFGTAAAIGGSLEDSGQEAAMTLGFTSATIGTLVAIIGGIIMAKWGAETGRTAQIGDTSELPEELRTGLISIIGQRPAIGHATSSPSSLEPLALHVAVVGMTTIGAYGLQQGVAALFPRGEHPAVRARLRRRHGRPRDPGDHQRQEVRRPGHRLSRLRFGNRLPRRLRCRLDRPGDRRRLRDPAHHPHGLRIRVLLHHLPLRQPGDVR